MSLAELSSVLRMTASFGSCWTGASATRVFVSAAGSECCRDAEGVAAHLVFAGGDTSGRLGEGVQGVVGTTARAGLSGAGRGF
jgi:hypothetical protein